MSITNYEKEKYSKVTISNSKLYLNDAEQAKKELRNEYRKIRIKQAREQWNEKAKEIRQKIREEKERQLKGIEAIKEQELNLWRTNVLAQKHHDYYQNSRYNIGSAHRAAKEEIERIEKARQSVKDKSTKKIAANLKEGEKHNAKPARNDEQHTKRKRDYLPFNDNDLCNTDFKFNDFLDDCSECRMDNETEGRQSVCSVDSCESDSYKTASSQEVPSPKRLAKKPPTKNFPKRPKTANLNENRYAANNRQNKSLIATKSPSKKKTAQPTLKGKQLNGIDSLVVQLASTAPPNSERDTNFEEVSREIVTEHVEKISPRKRYNQVSELIRKKSEQNAAKNAEAPFDIERGQKVDASVQVNTEAEELQTTIMQAKDQASQERPLKEVSSVTRFSAVEKQQPLAKSKPSVESRSTGSDFKTLSTKSTRSKNVAISLSSSKTPTSSSNQSPRKAVSTTTYIVASQPTSPKAKAAPTKTSVSKTSLPKSLASGATVDISSKPSVQYYDYNNKFSKEYPIAKESLLSKTPADPCDHNAIENAAIEKGRMEALSRKTEALKQRAQARGQAALEKEQIRRECMELTEKLDALSKTKPLLPSDVNLFGPHYMESKKKIRENKVKDAVEHLFLEPAIITLPEVKSRDLGGHDMCQTAPSAGVLKSNEINLGDNDDFLHSVNSSDSTPSAIMLGYVEDRRTKIQAELASSKNDLEKMKKLQNLLARLENIRSTLLSEWENLKVCPQMMAKINAKLNEESGHQQNITSIFKERTCKGNKVGMPGKSRDVDDIKIREEVLRQKEEEFERKLREYFEQQRAVNEESSKKQGRPLNATIKSGAKGEVIDRRQIPYDALDKPIEIVIKVKSDGTISKKSASKGEAKSKKERSGNVAAENKKPIAMQENYDDSNSTSYRSLPQNVNAMAPRTLIKNENNNAVAASREEGKQRADIVDDAAAPKIPTRMNPLLAQYIQRLLGMSRDSVKLLGVSSSDIESPSSSVMNSSTNVAQSSHLADDDHLHRVQRFLNENYSFVSDLEQSLNQTRQNTSLEANVDETRLREVWRTVLKKHMQVAASAATAVAIKNAQASKKSATAAEAKKKAQPSSARESKKKKPPSLYDTHSTIPTDSSDLVSSTTEEDLRKSMPQQNKGAATMGPPRRVRAKSQPQASGQDKQIAMTPKSGRSEDPIKQYERLTENCAKRMEELTALINKVREDKQRLVEATVTSLSDTGRNSTEYLDLPEGKDGKSLFKKKKPPLASSNSSSHNTLGSRAQSSDLVEIVTSTSISDNMPESDREGEPKLQKNKIIGVSRDSGISVPSRPLTVQGHTTDQDDPEYNQLSSQSQSVASAKVKGDVKKPSPPKATLVIPATPVLHHRGAAYVAPEKDHDLSTILEVDTPCNTSRVQNIEGMADKGSSSQQPLSSTPSILGERQQVFPSYTQYIRALGEPDPDQSFIMEHEYRQLISAVQKGQGDNAINYQEFPTLIGYFKNLSAMLDANPIDFDVDDPEVNSKFDMPKTYNHVLSYLCIDQVHPQKFPSPKEYMERMARTESVELLDSKSLEDIAENSQRASCGFDSDTLDVVEELKKRAIIKVSFPNVANKSKTARSQERSKYMGKSKLLQRAYAQILNNSDPDFSDLCASDSSTSDGSDFLSELLTLNNLEEMRMSETDSSPIPSAESPSRAKGGREKRRENEGNNSSGDSQQPQNIQEWLKRELLKHCERSRSSSSLSDESMQSLFMPTLLEEMSLQVSLDKVRSGDQDKDPSKQTTANERQKTSTPVFSQTSSTKGSLTNLCRGSGSIKLDTQMFSSDSTISSIHQNKKSKAKGKNQESEEAAKSHK